MPAHRYFSPILSGSPGAPLQPLVERKQKYIIITWKNQDEGYSPIYGYHIRYQEQRSRKKRQDNADAWEPILELSSAQPQAQINLNDLKPSTNYSFRVRAINAQGISPPSPASKVYRTPASLVSKSAKVFHTQWWFLVIVALTGVILILLIITLLCYVEKRRSKGKEMKRSTTATTVMSTPEPEDGGFPSLEMRQSRRSLARNGKIHNNIYARSPPRPSPASVTYSEDIPPPMAGAAAAASIKPPLSEDNSSVLSEKPSNLGDSSSEETSDSDDSSDNSIAKAPVPSSPPPPAFSSHFNRATSSNSSNHYPGHSRFTQNQHPNRSTRSSRSGVSAGAGGHSNSSSSNPTPTVDLGDGAGAAVHSTGPSWRFQKPSNAYTYTDSEAESSHYAFSLNNGNIVVNNVAGARTPLAGFSSFV
ncbi:sidekick-2 [Plakobranchus ocellatus]|uniref:Sidekick-2 n=1 Tax=Plakobranchus ocellatus TaxID=259542 RepID=A0AAV3Y723_9GAST|nr:sidekick-2 [Plakobranchus ocellatus]